MTGITVDATAMMALLEAAAFVERLAEPRRPRTLSASPVRRRVRRLGTVRIPEGSLLHRS
jgi:hypothetical protein